MKSLVGKYDTAASRWAGVGPYYAMFPADFADSVIEKYTQPGDTVLDPFAGRGTAVFSAAVNGRCGIGIELNPVGWVYARAKLRPAPLKSVEERLSKLSRNAQNFRRVAADLPEFFHSCFTDKVRRFLCAARSELDWSRRAVDWTAMAILLINLHGKRNASLSNQMRQTKSMSPDYAVRWWREHKLPPPDVDPIEFLRKRLNWRYAKGRPKLSPSQVYLGDSVHLLPDLHRSIRSLDAPPPRLLFTSPPYCGVTNYHYDQWLRLWLLGGEPLPSCLSGRYRGRFADQEKYRELLEQVFYKAARLLSSDSVIYVRTDMRKTTYDITKETLQKVFPDKKLTRRVSPFRRPTQTRLFGDKSPKVGEVDLILLPE